MLWHCRCGTSDDCLCGGAPFSRTGGMPMKRHERPAPCRRGRRRGDCVAVLGLPTERAGGGRSPTSGRVVVRKPWAADDRRGLERRSNSVGGLPRANGQRGGFATTSSEYSAGLDRQSGPLGRSRCWDRSGDRTRDRAGSPGPNPDVLRELAYRQRQPVPPGPAPVCRPFRRQAVRWQRHCLRRRDPLVRLGQVGRSRQRNLPRQYGLHRAQHAGHHPTAPMSERNPELHPGDHHDPWARHVLRTTCRLPRMTRADASPSTG